MSPLRTIPINLVSSVVCQLFGSGLTVVVDMVNNNTDPEAMKTLSLQKSLRNEWHALDPEAEIFVLPTIEHALERVNLISGKEGEVQIFVTGGFHLVGGVLSILEGQDFGLQSVTKLGDLDF
jgi:folylpolyglutamate synthase